jgi:hypothetical protein
MHRLLRALLLRQALSVRFALLLFLGEALAVLLRCQMLSVRLAQLLFLR